MKKNLFAILVGLFLFNGLIMRAQNATGYGPWTPVSGWSGLQQYHLKHGSLDSTSQKYTWWIEFQNTYEKAITFSFNVGEAGTTPQLTGPLAIQLKIPPWNAGATWYTPASCDYVEVVVGNEAFGDLPANALNPQPIKFTHGTLGDDSVVPLFTRRELP